MALIIYKNGRKYSNIKFGSTSECLDFIKFNRYNAGDTYNIFEYPSGEFYTQYTVDQSLSIGRSNNLSSKPRKRHFKS